MQGRRPREGFASPAKRPATEEAVLAQEPKPTGRPHTAEAWVRAWPLGNLEDCRGSSLRTIQSQLQWRDLEDMGRGDR